MCRATSLPERTVDVAICGAGIMGAMLAERLSAAGHEVAVLDRRPPGHGSTSASTALVLWEADVPLTHLARKLGEREAVRRWRRVHRAATGLWERFDREKIASDRIARLSLYLEGDVLDSDGLAGGGGPAHAAWISLQRSWRPRPLPSALRSRHARRSSRRDSFEANPLRLTLALLDVARKRGATVTYPVDVLRLPHDADTVVLVSDQGDVTRASRRPRHRL